MSVFAVRHEGAVQTRYARQVWWFGYLAIVGGGLLIAAVARRRVTEPFLGVSLALILLLLTGWLVRPRVTLYATLFLTAVSDIVTVWWFPFVKNLSSRESISFVADALTISPLEISLYLGVVISMMRRFARTRTLFPKTALTWPLLIFTGFVAYGFMRGIQGGGNLRIAVIEGRALFYILLVFIIAVNECTEHRHFRGALVAVLAGVVVQSVLSFQYLGHIDAATRATLESLNEHGSALAQNLMIVTLIAFVLMKAKAPILKLALIVGAIPTVYVYFVSQRRAGVAALLVAGAFVAIALFWRRRRAFWLITPFVALLLTGYSLAFWNSESSLGFPAQAIKTIVAPDQASAEDQSSDLYRTVEAYDLNFTIRQAPLTGLGFGQAFYRPVQLANIDVFGLNAYMPHNSVLWIWIKTGFGGFAAMFYLFGKSVMLGADRVRRGAQPIEVATMLSAACFAAMFMVYSYVDVSWDARNCVFLGLALAICTSATRLVGDDADSLIDDGADYELPAPDPVGAMR